MRNYEQITRKQLVDARDIYESLLRRKTKESEWQRFFATHPYVLSTSIPLILRPEYIVPMGRPGKPDPDFVFYPQEEERIPYYGVIELKRPDSEIVTITRSNIAILTRDAQTAVEQSKVYVKELGVQLLNANRTSLCLGNQAFIFVIMGLHEEISQKLGEKLFREQIENMLPANLQLLPYDTLFNQFEARIPPEVMMLVPEAPREVEVDIEKLLEELDAEERHFWDAEMCG